MVDLCINIDHVATVRQARRTYEPDPVWAAVEAQLGGADGITMHLREDRRHIQDADLQGVKRACHVKLNLEMAATDEMVEVAVELRPDMVMLVPEGRQEITTEGGLDIAGQRGRLRDVVGRLMDAGLTVSAFIDADTQQVATAARAGFSVCEVHTGPYAHAFHASGGDLSHADVIREVGRVAEAGRAIQGAGMRFNAGHALNYLNVGAVAAMSGLCQLHIGHAVVSRAIFVGMREAVREMKRRISSVAG